MNEFELGQSLGYLVNKSSSIMRICLNKEFSRRNIKASAERWGILNIVKACPGLTQSEIAMRSFKDKTNVTRMLNVLEKHGHIERRENSNDKRTYNIYITDKGTMLLEQLIPIVMSMNAAAYKNFTPNEMKQLHFLLNKLLDTITGQ
ncbi:MAG: MarR family transcriptional regulator [bacterium]